MKYEQDHTPTPEKPVEKSVFISTYEASQLDPRGMPLPLEKLFDQLYGVGNWELKMQLVDEAERIIRIKIGEVASTASNLEFAGLGHIDHYGNEVPKDIARQPRFNPKYDLYVTPEAAQKAIENKKEQ